jgi:hypothetical protein
VSLTTLGNRGREASVGNLELLVNALARQEG